MKILLTGATGFVGKAVNENLKEYSVNLLSRNAPTNLSDNFYVKTISSFEDYTDCLEDVDVVIHTAARVHQMNDKSINSMSDYIETNCSGTLNLARQAVKSGVKRFIFISTIKVNGEKTTKGSPFRYDDPRNGSDPYSLSKSRAEQGLISIARESTLEVTIIRPPLIYGPGVKANFRSLMLLASKNLPLPFGNFDNKRSFVSIKNLIDLILTCINHPKAANQVFLVSDDCDISTSELVSKISESFGNKPKLLKVNLNLLRAIAKVFNKREAINRLGDDLQIDIEHTKKTLNWKPIISIDEGIKLCAQNFTDNE